jgi:leucyl aminopeptidase
MSDLLPKNKNFEVIQSVGRITNAALAKLDGLIVITPHKIPALLWQQVPGGKALRTIDKRSGAGALIFSRLPNHRATGVWLHKLPGTDADAKAVSTYGLLKWAARAIAEALGGHPRNLGIVVLGLKQQQTEQILHAITLATTAHAFQLPAWRSKPEKHQSFKKLHLIGLDQRLDLSRILAEGKAINLARWLTALPANKLTTGAYRDLLVELAQQHGWKSRYYGLARLKKLGAGAFLAVAQGNADKDAGILHLQYRPASGAQQPRLALVGKAIIFDTGGNNLKPFKSMLDMHEDMGGSAVAVATLKALTEINFPYPVDCWLAITENRIGPQAYKSRDIVTALNGTTIEVIHTDAEGRMVLADTLTLAGQHDPDLVIDYATLTGACHYSLTDRYSGVFTNRTALNSLLIDAGKQSGERVWPFPMDADYDDDLKSNVADILQCSTGNEADQILAARFLQRFTRKESPWVHIDLSAVTRKSGLGQVPSGVTGFGVRYTLNLLHEQAEALTQILDTSLPVVTR